MRVLISGAGIAGPTLAWFLAKTGATITVIERSHAILPHGQNIDLQGTSIKVMRKMGLFGELRRNNTTEKGTVFINQKGRPFAPFPVDGPGSLTSEHEILRGDLAAVLYRATKDHPNIDYIFNTSVDKVISNDEKSVKVQLSNGEIRESDLLVAADGQWSKTRKQCFPPESIKVVDRNMIAVYFTVPRLPEDNDWWNIYVALKSRIVTTRPDPHGTIRAMFTIMPSSEAQKQEWLETARSDKKTQEALLRKEFADAGWEAQRLLDAMDEAPDFYFHIIQQIKMSKWSNNRVVCLGDAAYCASPITGQGAPLSMVGAYILAGELSKLDKGEHPSSALEVYERMFHPYTDEVQNVPSFIPGIAHPETPFKRWLLLAVLSSISKVLTIPWIKHKIGTGDSEEDGFPLPEYSMFAEDEKEKIYSR